VITLGAYQSPRGCNTNPEFKLFFVDGASKEVWNGMMPGAPSASDLIRATQLLNDHGVKLELDPIDESLEKCAIASVTEKSREDILRVFENIDELIFPQAIG
jgi:hypothetical protein